MRPLWKGAVTFGLIYVPVKIYAATEKKDIKFNYLHDKCNTPVRYKRYCPYCDSEVDMNEIVRGYEYEKGRYIKLSREELETAQAENPHNVEILEFIDLRQIDPLYYDRSYFFGPGEGGKKVYQLLRRAMEETQTAAVARVTLRSKESIAVIRPVQGALIMETMFYADEVRSTDGIEGLNSDDTSLHENEIKMAVNLIKNLSADFEPAKYNNNHRDKVYETIQGKITGETVVEKPAVPGTEKVVDLMAALKASIDMAKEQRTPKKSAAKKSTARKAQEK